MGTERVLRSGLHSFHAPISEGTRQVGRSVGFPFDGCIRGPEAIVSSSWRYTLKSLAYVTDGKHGRLESPLSVSLSSFIFVVVFLIVEIQHEGREHGAGAQAAAYVC